MEAESICLVCQQSRKDGNHMLAHTESELREGAGLHRSETGTDLGTTGFHQECEQRLVLVSVSRRRWSVNQENSKDTEILADSLYYLYSVRKDLEIVLSIETLELFCFPCDVELLDEHITRQFGDPAKKIVALRKHILCLMQDYYLQHAGLKILGYCESLQSVGVNLLGNIALPNSFSAAMYAVWSVPYLRYVFLVLTRS